MLLPFCAHVPLKEETKSLLHRPADACGRVHSSSLWPGGEQTPPSQGSWGHGPGRWRGGVAGSTLVAGGCRPWCGPSLTLVFMTGLPFCDPRLWFLCSGCWWGAAIGPRCSGRAGPRSSFRGRRKCSAPFLLGGSWVQRRLSCCWRRGGAGPGVRLGWGAGPTLSVGLRPGVVICGF